MKTTFFRPIGILLLLTGMLIPIQAYKLQAKSGRTTKWISFLHDKQDKMRVRWNGRNLEIQLKPRKGEGGYSLSRRVLNRGHRGLSTIRRYNGGRKLLMNRNINFPVKVVNGLVRSDALKAIFPKDRPNKKGWRHEVKYPWETTTLLAGLFTKTGITAQHLTRYNQLRRNGNLLRKKDPILIPWKWISPELEMRKLKLKEPLLLTYDKLGRAFGEYRLRKGETLYSSVVIRFTGRMLHDEVDQMAKELLKINGIQNARRISRNQRIRIPVDWLSEEFLYDEDSSGTAGSAKSTVKPKKPNPNYQLHVILDAGHGGRDPGAMAGNRKRGDKIYEDEVVYDITQRMADLLKKEGFVVHPTLIDPNQRKPVKRLQRHFDQDEYLNVTPHYKVRNSRTGVNMRVFLINHIYNKLLKKKIPKENIVFLSIHGDALHSSLRGAMVYYPDQRFRRNKFKINGRIYKKRKEFSSKIHFSSSENRISAELSRALGHSVIATFREFGLVTHRGTAVRGYLYRRGRKTLPAVLRYSMVPTSVLIEVANLNNLRDRRSLLKSKTRQRMAQSLVKSIRLHYRRTGVMVAKR